MGKKKPILLSFYACSNGRTTLFFGQLTFTGISDLTFKNYSKQKTLRTLLRLYQTRPCVNQDFVLVFNSVQVQLKTNGYGAFYSSQDITIPHSLTSARLPDGTGITILDELYDLKVHYFKTGTMIISDVDDTLIHSHIYRKVKKFRTLMFTAVEKRKAVSSMQQVIRYFVNEGAESVYLSNSEQNLYPIIYRFLQLNKFPKGPIFLKQLRSFWDVLLNIKFPLRDAHKIITIEHLIKLFPENKFVLIGDNTQRDLDIYIDIAFKFPKNVVSIFIRQVVKKKKEETRVEEFRKQLADHRIELHYSDSFPSHQLQEIIPPIS